MKKVLFGLLTLTCFAFSKGDTKVETYNYGQNGMELVARSKKGVIIVSTFNSKMTIRQEIARKLYDLYLANKLQSDKKITVDGSQADVTGKCIIRKKNTLTAVDFYYEEINWNSGLKEVYKSAIPQPQS
ncbi:MAG TPA: hypothetical protein PKN96_02310 [Flavobacterium sp.]|uniref:hypothetical protein n=1 Tax=Flavobacterium sp. TaxID=239 RepID=UPI002CFCD080|nr:hypothetical protein [Flavobacterium sp.]HNP32107.1 hypothetical protein [Flavobacterium sp.]